MRAIVMTEFGGPEVLVPRDVAEPAAAPGWVTVRLHASALNWHDVLVRRGNYSSPLPHTPGADGAGVRMDSGEQVMVLPSLFWGGAAAAPGPDFQILGDNLPGTYAEYVTVPEECLAPRPAGFTWEQAAALPLVGVTCYRALVTRACLQPGESLLIVGAGGGIATMASLLGQALEAEVVVTGSSPAKIEQACAGGASAGVLHSRDDWPQQAAQLTPQGRGFDVILDPAGVWERSIEALAPGGRLVVLGANIAETASVDIRRFFFGQYSILGTTMGAPADFRGLLELTRTGRLRPPPIAEVFGLDDAAQAHRALEAGRGGGKIVLSHR